MNKVMRYMMDCLAGGEHVDLRGEVELTQLAEDACCHFDGYDGNDDIPECYFEMAYEVAEKWERMPA